MHVLVGNQGQGGDVSAVKERRVTGEYALHDLDVHRALAAPFVLISWNPIRCALQSVKQFHLLLPCTGLSKSIGQLQALPFGGGWAM